jgi:hypothetical protein
VTVSDFHHFLLSLIDAFKISDDCGISQRLNLIRNFDQSESETKEGDNQ